MRKIDNKLAKLINDAAEDAGYEIRSYSGRAMYGDKCLGISFDRGEGTDIVIDILSYIHNENVLKCGSECENDNFDDICESLKGARADSMGLGGIIYWPHIPYVGSEDSDQDELED